MAVLNESLRSTIEQHRLVLRRGLSALTQSRDRLLQTLEQIGVFPPGQRLWQPKDRVGLPAPDSGIDLERQNERRRIARELHDEFGQSLTVLSMGLKSTQELCADNAAACQQLQQLQSLVGDMHTTVRELIFRLRPAALDQADLHEALTQLIVSWSRHAAIEPDMQIGGFSAPLSEDVQATIYRIVQEALTNVAKHAQARHVSIVVQQRGNELLVIVEDDGRGCEVQPGQSNGHGLKGIQERLAPLGGSLEVESSPGKGTTLYVRIPLTDTEEK